MAPDFSVDSPETDPRTILERLDDGLFAVDTDWKITYANDRGRSLLRHAMDGLDAGESIEGRHLWTALPEATDTVFEEKYREALDSQEAVSFEAYYDPLDAWFDIHAFPSTTGLTVHVRDVTDQKRIQQERQESLKALQQLYAISADCERDLDAKVEAILEVGCEYLDLPNGFLTRIDSGIQTIDLASATHPDLQPGESCPLDEAYCKRTVELDQLLTVVNAADEGWSDDPAFDRFELGTYIGGRVTVDDELYGTLCFADTATRARQFTDTQRTFVELLTRWVSYELERRQAEAQLQRERDRLDEFAGIVSHDLRTPLATANSRAQLLEEDVESEHVRPLIRSFDRMADLLDDLLSLARAGKLVEETSPVSLRSVTDAAWRTVDTEAAELAVECGDATVRASESRLQQLFENLFRNSVEHGSTSPGSGTEESDGAGGRSVTVTVGTLEDRRGFYVADDGPGIPAAERDEVFEAGYTTTDAGTGFGLNIVEQVATAHDWTVTVGESASGGARFEIAGVSFEEA